MLTGDAEATARAIAAEVGIDEVLAGVLPEGKSAAVTRLKGEGRRVAMAGDGVNDAPALAAADVGIAMGTGSDVAIESAGVTLAGGDVAALPRAALSRATLGNIRQNLFFAFVYNVDRRSDRGGRSLPGLRPSALARDRERRDDVQLALGGATPCGSGAWPCSARLADEPSAPRVAGDLHRWARTCRGFESREIRNKYDHEHAQQEGIPNVQLSLHFRLATSLALTASRPAPRHLPLPRLPLPRRAFFHARPR